MTQVVIFFGWLVLVVGFTLSIFGHIAITFVHGPAAVWETLWPSQGVSSLVYVLVALVPGGLLLGLGYLMRLWERRAAESSQDAPQSPEA